MGVTAKRQGREQALSAKKKLGGARFNGGCLPNTIHLQCSASQECRLASEPEPHGLGCESLQYSVCVLVEEGRI